MSLSLEEQTIVKLLQAQYELLVEYCTDEEQQEATKLLLKYYKDDGKGGVNLWELKEDTDVARFLVAEGASLVGKKPMCPLNTWLVQKAKFKPAYTKSNAAIDAWKEAGVDASEKVMEKMREAMHVAEYHHWDFSDNKVREFVESGSFANVSYIIEKLCPKPKRIRKQ